jgi:hypothetical protein
MKVINGQPIRYKSGHVYHEGCCDCRLMHTVMYRIVGKSDIEVITFRNDFLTKRARRKKK